MSLLFVLFISTRVEPEREPLQVDCAQCEQIPTSRWDDLSAKISIMSRQERTNTVLGEAPRVIREQLVVADIEEDDETQV